MEFKSDCPSARGPKSGRPAEIYAAAGPALKQEYTLYLDRSLSTTALAGQLLQGPHLRRIPVPARLASTTDLGSAKLSQTCLALGPALELKEDSDLNNTSRM